jgi:transcriptional repressor NrdR
LEDKVIDSRTSRDGGTTRRRRECLGCGHRYTTREHIEEEDLLVVKSNGSRQPFDREKLLRGIVRACEKRPVTRDTLEKVTDEILSELQAMNQQEVHAKLIGMKVMEKLSHIDKVAFVRFASVYRQFEDVGEFIEEIQHLQRRGPQSGAHPELFGING